MKAYRQWLPAAGYEGTASVGGSFVSNNIEDYYVTPYEMGYGTFVKFDHDFIGREALEEMQGKPHRRKVTFEWNGEDVATIMALDVRRGPALQVHRHAGRRTTPRRRTTAIMCDGKRRRRRRCSRGYSYNERAMLSLGIIDEEFATPGTQVTLVWGEPDGGTPKTTVERSRQFEIRALVAPVPYAREVRETYHSGWRSTGSAT